MSRRTPSHQEDASQLLIRVNHAPKTDPEVRQVNSEVAESPVLDREELAWHPGQKANSTSPVPTRPLSYTSPTSLSYRRDMET